MTPGRRLAVLCARLRLPAYAVGLLLLVGGLLAQRPVVTVAGFVLFALGLALYFRLGTLRRDPLVVRPPVLGRWEALNSPATKVPSHGLHAYGQTYAIDILRAPEGSEAPVVGSRRSMAPPQDFPSFGEPVLAVADGVVVSVRDSEKDHASRGGVGGLLRFVVEAQLRELLGPRWVLGNSVVLDIGGAYALVAHLRHGSVTVRPGQRVREGQQVAECGNTGNSTEPHVHFQLMDVRRAWLAAGVPFRFRSAAPAGPEADENPPPPAVLSEGVLPANGERFDAAPPAQPHADAASAAQPT